MTRQLAPSNQWMYENLLEHHGIDVARNYAKVCLTAVPSPTQGHKFWRSHAETPDVKTRVLSLIQIRPQISETGIQTTLGNILPVSIQAAIAELMGEGEIVRFQRFLPNGKPLDEMPKFVPADVPVPCVPFHALPPELKTMEPKAVKAKPIHRSMNESRKRKYQELTERIRKEAIALRDKGVYFTVEELAARAGCAESSVQPRVELWEQIDRWRKSLPTAKQIALKEAISRLSSSQEPMTVKRLSEESGLAQQALSRSKELQDIAMPFIAEHNSRLEINRKYQQINTIGA